MSTWLVSARFDIGFFVAPGVLSVLVLLLSPDALVYGTDLPVWGWLLFVVLIDVSHVYASLYRTYFDSEEFQRRKGLYTTAPILVFLGSVLLYAIDDLFFWRILAYAAVIHFIRQQYGFMALYKYRRGERDKWELHLDRCLIYMTMLYPLAYWHTHLPRKFVWFIEGDFFSIPVAHAVTWVGWMYVGLMVTYLMKEIWMAYQGRPLNPGKHLVMTTTALVWYIGIVQYNSDYSFTVTNVVLHGVPYMALVWFYCRRKWKTQTYHSWLQTISRPAWVMGFVGILILFAFLEEGLWDLLIWGDHPMVFGGIEGAWIDGSELLAIVVPLLVLPQATHYILDAFIWKLNASNPDLKGFLFGDR
jgi:hypothetical protein